MIYKGKKCIIWDNIMFHKIKWNWAYAINFFGKLSMMCVNLLEEKQNTAELCMSDHNEMLFKKLFDFILHNAGNKLRALH